MTIVDFSLSSFAALLLNGMPRPLGRLENRVATELQLMCISASRRTVMSLCCTPILVSKNASRALLPCSSNHIRDSAEEGERAASRIRDVMALFSTVHNNPHRPPLQ